MRCTTAWLFAAFVGLSVGGCASGTDTTGSRALGTGPGNGAGTTGDAGGGGSYSCATCSGTDDSGSVGSDAASGLPSVDDATAPDDAPTAVDGSMQPPPFMLPPISLPEAGPAASGDGGACTSKICIDPVFDCPLQGCFNGCTNFHCM